jgi:osmotically inducible protein OsmC
VVRSALTVRARVPGVDQETFDKCAEAARTGCPIARALNPSIQVTVDAALVN